MEWILYLCGISSGAFMTLGAFVLVFFFKTRGFRLNLEIMNQAPGPRLQAKSEDYYAQAHGLDVPGDGSKPVPVLHPEAPARD